MLKIYRYIGLILIVFVSVQLSGCWDSKELDDLQLPIVAGFDKITEDEKLDLEDRCVVTVAGPVFYEGVEDDYQVQPSPSYAIGESRGIRNTKVAEELILGQLQVILISSEIAKEEDTLEILDIVSRNIQVRDSIYIGIVEGRAKDLIDSKYTHYPNSGIYLKSLLETIDKTNFYPNISLFQFNRHIINDYMMPLVPLIKKEGEDIQIIGSCYINNGKLANKLGRKETETAVLITGIEGRGTMSYPVYDGESKINDVSFQGSNKREVRVKNNNGKYEIDIKIKLKGVIVESLRQVHMQNSKDMIKLAEVSLEQQIKGRAEEFIKKVQTEWGYDALHVALHIKAMTRERLTKEDIDKIIKNAKINVEVDVNIENTGGKL